MRVNFAAVLSRCLQHLIAKKVYRRLRIKLVGNRAERENENLSVINAPHNDDQSMELYVFRLSTISPVIY